MPRVDARQCRRGDSTDGFPFRIRIMCGRFTQHNEEDEFEDRFNFSNRSGILFKKRFNIAPSQNVPVVVVEHDARVLKLMRWGLVPFWAKDASVGYKMINARAETITEKASFKNALKNKRCLVLASGFYEWVKNQKRNRKIPLYFRLKSREPFAFAGLWDEWKQPDGDKLFSFTIITTGPNELMKPIHNRMPAILRQTDENMWLDPELMDFDKLTPLLRPYPTDLMEAYEVSTIVNSPKTDVPECIKPLELDK
jgi:putative SOS response-associated peptidase YedK